ncbi:Hachiman antiphage defense system protein HamA [Mycobacteroides abscessus]|uniref:Hachiman antiphage defense system protein HamA n=1 Tax=Mycobacteroides abscessus TaxID=36809 RepID=UPI00266BE174|nr:Hachiman antiphage defense system protein HamA [Mycobacteroides abscessus]MDO3215853.1 hypothetical protein [Mycobacteroides abscessus subsp. abscessus]
MRDLGLDPDSFASVVTSSQLSGYVLIRMSAGFATELSPELGIAFRRCYVTDGAMNQRATETGATRREIVKVKLPDRGSVMAGDFGEILTSLVQAIEDHQSELLDPRKWRLKNDRTKPAPRSDVVQFVLPEWPEASADDRLICSEVKTKSTASEHSPILHAISDSEKDSDGRLVKTLVWLRERALDTGLETVSVGQLDRFINAVDYPAATHEFRAVAVVCADLIESELKDIELPDLGDRALIVLVVPDLKDTYESVYDAILETVADDASAQ